MKVNMYYSSKSVQKRLLNKTISTLPKNFTTSEFNYPSKNETGKKWIHKSNLEGYVSRR